MNIGLIAELTVKCLHKDQNIMKIFVRRIFGFIRDFELGIRMSSANNNAENLYKMVKAASDLAVRTAVYAPN